MGEFFSLLTALLFAAGTIFFKKSVGTVSAFALNLFKNAITLALLAVTAVAASQTPPVPGRDLAIALVSGALGIGISDTLFFMTLHRLGAGRTAMIDFLYSPFVILLSLVLLGESLPARAAAGGMMILTGIALCTEGRFGGNLSRRELWIGGALGSLAMATVALSIVLVKPILGSYPSLWLSTIRTAGGTAILLAALPFHPERATVLSAFRPQTAWKWMLPGAILGSYLSATTWLVGFKYAQAGVAALLNQTSTLWIVAFAWLFLGEPLTRVKVLAVGIAFAGAALIVS